MPTNQVMKQAVILLFHRPSKSELEVKPLKYRGRMCGFSAMRIPGIDGPRHFVHGPPFNYVCKQNPRRYIWIEKRILYIDID